MIFISRSAFLLLLFLLATPGFTSGGAQPRVRAEIKSSPNQTSIYQNYLKKQDALSRSSWIKLLAPYQVVFVPGYLYDPLTGAADFSLAEKLRMGEYFTDQLKWLRDLGISSEIMVLNSENSVEQNALNLVSRLERYNKPLIIVSHSKGSLETLEALRIQPRLRDQIRSWISLQAPFYGSPIADLVDEDPTLRAISKKLLENLWDGTIDSLVDLKTCERGHYMEMHRIDFEDIVFEVPMISVGSYIKERGFFGRSVMDPFRDFVLDATNEDNDGLVSLSSSILPLSRYVILEDVDHAQPVMPSLGKSFNRLEMLQTLLRMELEPHSNRGGLKVPVSNPIRDTVL